MSKSLNPDAKFDRNDAVSFAAVGAGVYVSWQLEWHLLTVILMAMLIVMTVVEICGAVSRSLRRRGGSRR